MPLPQQQKMLQALCHLEYQKVIKSCQNVLLSRRKFAEVLELLSNLTQKLANCTILTVFSNATACYLNKLLLLAKIIIETHKLDKRMARLKQLCWQTFLESIYQLNKVFMLPNVIEAHSRAEFKTVHKFAGQDVFLKKNVCTADLKPG